MTIMSTMWAEERPLVFHMSRGHKAATRAVLAGFSAVVLLLAVVVYVPQLPQMRARALAAQSGKTTPVSRENFEQRMAQAHFMLSTRHAGKPLMRHTTHTSPKGIVSLQVACMREAKLEGEGQVGLCDAHVNCRHRTPQQLTACLDVWMFVCHRCQDRSVSGKGWPT